ncbi:hypothetical protein ACWEQO_29090 [Streptomyces sp. NPDC004051]
MHNNVPSAALCGARRPGWEHGPAIGIHRIPCVLERGHVGEHANAFGQAWPDPLADADQAAVECAFCRIPATEQYSARTGGTFATCGPCGRSHRYSVAGEKTAVLFLKEIPELAGRITVGELAVVFAGAMKAAGVTV